jgi:hypothetical protein
VPYTAAALAGSASERHSRLTAGDLARSGKDTAVTGLL